jgi:hypothetical protein
LAIANLEKYHSVTPNHHNYFALLHRMQQSLIPGWQNKGISANRYNPYIPPDYKKLK